jgi:hypothetical protein
VIVFSRLIMLFGVVMPFGVNMVFVALVHIAVFCCKQDTGKPIRSIFNFITL